MVCKSNKYAHLVLRSLDILFELNKLYGEGPANLWFADGLSRNLPCWILVSLVCASEKVMALSNVNLPLLG